MFIVIDNEWQDDVPDCDIDNPQPLTYDWREAAAGAVTRHNARIDYWNSLTEEQQQALLDEGHDYPSDDFEPDHDYDPDEETDF
jgi:hypothetical protein